MKSRKKTVRRRGTIPRTPAPRHRSTFQRFFHALGPGVITGAADDDPSGIATYSVAGAQLGTALLWTAPLLWPLMAAVQMMCARIGMVTGRGLIGALSRKFPRPLLAAAAGAVFIANTINVGADLGGMADAMHDLTGLRSSWWVPLFGIGIAVATIRLRYAAIARTLKWLALVLVVYVIAAIHLRPHWSTILHDTFVPGVPRSREAWATLVAILGTTISPYLFFWQASQEVEEEKAEGKTTVASRQGTTEPEIVDRGIDVGVGTFFSNLAMFFIIVTTASALHAHGKTDLATSADVAAALRPLAGRFAVLLYTVGLVGTGLLAIPTLAGSAAYAFAETFRWRQGIDERFPRAPAFYAIIGLSIAAGIAMEFAGVSAVKALYWTAVINGLLAPFLLIGVLLAAADRKLMRGQPSPMLGRVVVGFTALAMFAAGIAMFVV
jgi:Mn2+/Fe2+ NRAMP family transporter